MGLDQSFTSLECYKGFKEEIYKFLSVDLDESNFKSNFRTSTSCSDCQVETRLHFNYEKMNIANKHVPDFVPNKLK